MSHHAKKALWVLLLVLTVSLISACETAEETPETAESEESVSDRLKTLNQSTNHTYTYEIEMSEVNTIESVYQRDGEKHYYSFNGESLYQTVSDDSVVRIVRGLSGSWKREPVTNEPHLIPNDTIALNPELLTAEMLEEGEDQGYRLKKSAYETIFGEKAETITHFAFDPSKDPVVFNYSFTHEGSIVPVTVTITYGDADITLPI